MMVSAEINKRFAGVPHTSPSRHQYLRELLRFPASLSELKVNSRCAGDQLTRTVPSLALSFTERHCGKGKTKEPPEPKRGWETERLWGNLAAMQTEIGPPVRQLPGCRVRFTRASRPAACAPAPAPPLGRSRPPRLLSARAYALLPPTPSRLRSRVPAGGCFLVSVPNASRTPSAPWTGAISSSEFKPEAPVLSASPNSLS
ncbi:uncharacterized protein LOC115347927 [Aquila chrysaetos chrysaetos]|uniref:uncharacterized protein LOC115347927 n=1 Tax=Aquila chrysaetos chrysaetos TaxID=223781 RepID=UPI001176FFA1|nr:uncharacterized protein LOC115347927 [Aquila chrysaetos chrysaetos]